MGHSVCTKDNLKIEHNPFEQSELMYAIYILSLVEEQSFLTWNQHYFQILDNIELPILRSAAGYSDFMYSHGTYIRWQLIICRARMKENRLFG